MCHLNCATASRTRILFDDFKQIFVVHLLSMLRYSHWAPPVIMYTVDIINVSIHYYCFFMDYYQYVCYIYKVSISCLYLLINYQFYYCHIIPLYIHGTSGYESR